MTFSGLTSRWITPAACAAARPAAICTAMSIASESGSGCAPRRARSVRPSMYSIAMNNPGDRQLCRAVNRANVGMVQRRCRAGFEPQPREASAIVGDVSWKELYSDLLTKPEVWREPDLAHASGSKGSDDSIGIQMG